MRHLWQVKLWEGSDIVTGYAANDMALVLETKHHGHGSYSTSSLDGQQLMTCLNNLSLSHEIKASDYPASLDDDTAERLRHCLEDLRIDDEPTGPSPSRKTRGLLEYGDICHYWSRQAYSVRGYQPAAPMHPALYDRGLERRDAGLLPDEER